MSSLLRFFALVLLLLVPTSACGPGGRECEDNLNCELTEICQAGRCQVRSCQSSADCPIQHYCNDDLGSCSAGCLLDRDCLPDEICDEGACAKAGCRDTNLDCPVGHFCNSITGDCFPAGGFYCASCSGQGDNECGGSQNFCLSWSAGSFCGVDCSMGQQCPRGYDCVGITDGGGNLIGRNCVAPCWMWD